MAGKVLTATLIDNVKPPSSGRVEIADLRCSGLSFRVTKNGARSWCFRFRDPQSGATSRATIGSYPGVTLASARQRAEEMRTHVAAGVNPVMQRRRDRETSGNRTFNALAERYMNEHAHRNKRPRSAAEDRRNLDLHVLPRWGKRPYADIRRADVIELAEGLIADGKGTTANRVQALVSKIFSFAVDAELREDNPCHRLRKRHKEVVGERVLSDEELRLFWHGVVQAKGGRRTGLALRLALLTGIRRAEAAGICRRELSNLADAGSATWLIPGARTKNKRPHLIPLARLAREIILELSSMTGKEQEYLLPTQSNRRDGPMMPGSITQAMIHFTDRLAHDARNAVVRSWLTDPPSPHDLRRTLETRMAALGVPKEHRDRVLNHTPADVGSKHYDRHDYLVEKRAALTRWNDALQVIVSGS